MRRTPPRSGFGSGSQSARRGQNLRTTAVRSPCDALRDRSRPCRFLRCLSEVDVPVSQRRRCDNWFNSACPGLSRPPTSLKGRYSKRGWPEQSAMTRDCRKRRIRP
jgi:hypothetical protein